MNATSEKSSGVMAGPARRSNQITNFDEAEAPVRKRPVDPLLDHEYDGIREFDNPTPGWWHGLFILTIVFSVFYIAWYSLSPVALSLEESWEAKQTLENKKIFGKLGTLEGDDKTILGLMADEKMMRVGAGMFVSNCAACHGRDGGGINGVNLTDDAYKNVRTPSDLFTVINNGANQGAMPAWKDKMSSNERVLLAAYVASLRGTKPASPRAAEGQVIPAWSIAATTSAPEKKN